MIDFERETENFVEKIRQTKVCQEYFMQKEQVKQYPGLKQRIDDTGRKITGFKTKWIRTLCSMK